MRSYVSRCYCSAVVEPSLTQLFAGFFECALSGFGGVVAWAHRILVERRRWLGERDYAELLGLSQIMPGGNIVNISILVGFRFHGVVGTLVALAGLLIVPFCLLLAVNAALQGPAVEAVSQPALRGAAPVVAGLALTAGLKMARAYHWTPSSLVFGGLTLVAVAIVQLPLLAVLAVLAPLRIAQTWRTSSN